ncbi:MAG: hypothetical protein CMF50_06175 [Legionellales bacterium]|nr:hypothetical protein [Legionellales bacterium]
MEDSNIFRIIFVEDDEVLEIYANQVAESEMFGFIIVEELLFGEKSSVVVDPSEEKLKAQFQGVNCTYIPVHSIIRIDEVEKQGVAKATKRAPGSNISHLPSSIYRPPKGGNDSPAEK